MMGDEKHDDPREREAARMAYDDFLEDARGEPIKYFKHDTDAHNDDALYRLVDEHGMEWYGWYWLLIELLTRRRGHKYDVSSNAGWRKLSHDMSCLTDMSTDECKAFIAELAEYGLVSKEYLDELHCVAVRRILVDSERYAESVASKKLGAWKTNRRRMFGT